MAATITGEVAGMEALTNRPLTKAVASRDSGDAASCAIGDGGGGARIVVERAAHGKVAAPAGRHRLETLRGQTKQ
jgi:hypothetical protein